MESDCDCGWLCSPPESLTFTIHPGPSTEPDWDKVRELNPGIQAQVTYTDLASGLEIEIEMDPERAARTFERMTGRKLYSG